MTGDVVLWMDLIMKSVKRQLKGVEATVVHIKQRSWQLNTKFCKSQLILYIEKAKGESCYSKNQLFLQTAFNEPLPHFSILSHRILAVKNISFPLVYNNWCFSPVPEQSCRRTIHPTLVLQPEQDQRTCALLSRRLGPHCRQQSPDWFAFPRCFFRKKTFNYF